MQMVNKILSKSNVIFIIFLMVLSGCGPNETKQSEVKKENLSNNNYKVRIAPLSYENEENRNNNSRLNATAHDYYESISTQSGKELKAALHELIKKQNVLSYDETRSALEVIDQAPDNVDNILLFYKGGSVAKNSFCGNEPCWNREHVWAQSHFDDNRTIKTDLHNIRPEDKWVNARRGKLDFDWDDGHVVNPNASCTGTDLGAEQKAPDTCVDKNSWEPRDAIKGDLARTLLYMAVRYEGEGGPDLELVNGVDTDNPNHGRLSTLLQWHQQDPVDAIEIKRNNMIYEKYQHNRNPFVDHPEYVERIWD
ncbi:endonuclease I family protein [Bacillus thuringiensis]|uniref:endonuclease I family protein n=1 Tax=Bacillus thuringiensis TaxID=1428 RepID=UPI002D7E4501|nr:endonuclease [Bacillus thuringiensis]MEB4818360.1 endonuclease [Bacillus thuringiensis]